jgi:hypothetical protein
MYILVAGKKAFISSCSEARERQTCKYHEEVLELREESGEGDTADSRVNPIKRTVTAWLDEWKALEMGPRNGSVLA